MKRNLVISVAVLLAAISAVSVNAAPDAVASPAARVSTAAVPAYARHASTIKDEHLHPVAAGAHQPMAASRLSAMSLPRTAVRPALAQLSSNSPNGFLTIPFLSWKSINSIFDHCNPDYSTDGKVCAYDGSVALRSYGVDPSFSLGYATSPGSGNYLYYDGHNGWDFGLYYENVYASADGYVRIAGTDPVNPCFGTNIVIDHPNGFSTRYAHLSALYVSQGQMVTRGQIIGQSGNTGCSSGPHLHWGAYITSSWTAIDPYGWSGATGADPWPSDVGSLWLTGSPQYPLPDPPTAPTAVAGNNSALVTWQAPAFSGGMPITGYTVKAFPGGASASVSGNQTTATVPGLTNGISYTFQVWDANALAVSSSSGDSNAVVPGIAPTFYFSEGYTGPGFTETLSLLAVSDAGTATVDYYTENGHLPTSTITLAAGQPQVINVNAVVGANHMVSAKIAFSGLGVAERTMRFDNGAWRGSTNVIGATSTSTEWDFAEGSTWGIFNEFLSIQNPNGSPVTVDLNYMTDRGAHPVKTVTVPAATRVTVDVARGDLGGNASCIPSGDGASCGVGPGILGVSVQVKSRSLPVVAERPMYVNGYSFGSGPIRDGHDAFGATAPATQWYFAEGTTLPGFNEYLSLQNPGAAPARVAVNFMDLYGRGTVRNLVILPQSRTTVIVSDPVSGVGPGLPGVSVSINASQPIVAERPMYSVWNFGNGTVAGATDVLGATRLGKVYWFASGASANGETDFLTIQNPGGTTANVTASYHTPAGLTTRAFTVLANTRVTTPISDPILGAGPGLTSLWVQVASDQPVLVEKPSYSAGAGTYGATDTIGYVP